MSQSLGWVRQDVQKSGVCSGKFMLYDDNLGESINGGRDPRFLLEMPADKIG